MKNWYIAVCEKCGLARKVIVDGPIRTLHYLERDDQLISNFLLIHAGYQHSKQGLRLIYDDKDLDIFFDSGFRKAEEDDKVVQKLYELPYNDQSNFGHFIENLYIRKENNE